MSLPPGAYNAFDVSYACYPYFSPVGYVTLYIIERRRAACAEPAPVSIYSVQHADVFDEHTRTTNQYFQTLFPTAPFHRRTLPAELASDFFLLGTYAYGSMSETLALPRETLAALRDRVITYCELLETVTAGARTGDLHYLLAFNPDLRDARQHIFVLSLIHI